MDNFAIDVTSEGWIRFVEVVGLVFAGSGFEKATHYAVDGQCLTFYWAEPPAGSVPTMPLLFPMDRRQVADFAWGWVCDHEAEVTRGGSEHVRLSLGWRIHNTPSQVGGRDYVLATVQPIAAVHGK